MKKILFIFITSILLLPLGVFAEEYTIKDLTTSVDNSSWYVFTRDNLKDNPQLDEIGITYDYVNDFMNANDVYLDACRFDMDEPANTLEMFVVAKEVTVNRNLHVYSEKQIKKLGEAFKEKINADNYDIYTSGKYKYIHSKYYDQNTSFNVDEYYTVINGYGYTIMAQKANDFTAAELAEVKQVVDSTTYKYIASYEKKASYNNILIDAIIGAIAGGMVGLVKAIQNKKKKKAAPVEITPNDNDNNQI